MRNLTTLLALIPLALCAQTYYYITGIDVSPASPTDQDAITLTLHGDLSSSGAYIVSSSAQVFGGVLQIDVTADDPGGLAILVPHDEVIAVGTLPAGGYQITINGTHVSDGAPNGDHLLNVSGGGWPACDSVEILSLRYAAFHSDQLVVTVQNGSSELFDYPNFILFDNNHDTVAIETVNFFGIGGVQDHYLTIKPGVVLGPGSFSGTLELWTMFTQFHGCTVPIAADLCPPGPCSMVYINVTNTGGAMVNATMEWTITASGQTMGSGQIVLGALQMGTDSLCLPPGEYTLGMTSMPATPGGQIYFSVSEDQYFGGDQLQAPFVQNGGANTLDVPLFTSCSGPNGVGYPPSDDRTLVRITASNVTIERTDGAPLGNVRLIDATGRIVGADAGRDQRVVIDLAMIPTGLLLLHVEDAPTRRIAIVH
ncbi:MAG: hypothetical protein H6595_09805 [Flavobacteriales bacterium]|nr:hypothetical protein [Flavobacteriales bacterium]